MKLELKHLAAYLPYDIEVFEIPSQKSFTLDEYGLYVISDNWGYECYKPHLHPLSDLTKEITHNGAPFVAIEVLYDMCQVDAEHDFLDAVTDDWASLEDKIEFAPYTILQQLLSWHFDIFRLIDAGLAIDITTITKK